MTFGTLVFTLASVNITRVSTLASLSPALASEAGRPARRAMLVVDDHDLLRLGVRALVQAQTNPSGETVEVLEAGNLADAMVIYEATQDTIGLVLLDLALPDTQGLHGVANFRARYPAACIVVLSGTHDASLAKGALALGASAFLPKSADLSEVVSFIRACGLLDVNAVISLPAAARPTAGLAAHAGATRQQLTPRQQEILQWVLEGKANKEIAQRANLSEGTVKNHVSTILLLFGMRSRAQLISKLH
jgi:DNA-binding NarL/FixJ family response regulator